MSPVTRRDASPPVHFTGTVSAVEDTTLVRLPASASEQLPSRGQVAVQATLDGDRFPTVVEPDGRRGHWIRLAAPHAQPPGVTVEVTLEVAPTWPEPDVPPDLAAALDEAPASLHTTWESLTPMARWEWVRWVEATGNPGTRRRRVEVSISKMEQGSRRPCCFDLASCTDPAVARSGKLREPGGADGPGGAP